MKKVLCIVLAVIVAGAAVFAQPADPFSGGRWQGRISYKDASGISRSELYELILVPDGSCVVTVSGKREGQDVFQDADGLWSFDARFFRLDCDFPNTVFEHLPAIKWAGVYQFNAAGSRFSLLVKPYPDAPHAVKVAFNRVDD